MTISVDSSASTSPDTTVQIIVSDWSPSTSDTTVKSFTETDVFSEDCVTAVNCNQYTITLTNNRVNQDGDASWESKVFVVEKLGSGTFLYLEKDGEPLVAETEGHSNIKVGDTVKVGFPSNRCHLFDSSQQAFK